MCSVNARRQGGAISRYVPAMLAEPAAAVRGEAERALLARVDVRGGERRRRRSEQPSPCDRGIEPRRERPGRRQRGRCRAMRSAPVATARSARAAIDAPSALATLTAPRMARTRAGMTMGASVSPAQPGAPLRFQRRYTKNVSASSVPPGISSSSSR